MINRNEKNSNAGEKKPRSRVLRILGIHSDVVAAVLLAACAVLAVLYVYYVCKRTLGIIALGFSLAAVAMFCAVLLRCGGAIERLLRIGNRSEPDRIDQSAGHDGRAVALIALLFVLVFNALLVVIALSQEQSLKPLSSLNALWRGKNFDASHYLDIAKDWYVNSTDDLRYNIVFFPLYPLLVRGLHLGLRIPVVAAAHIISGGFAVGACTLLVRLARLDLDREASLRAVKYLLLFPCSFFLFLPMSESVFLFLSLGVFVCVRDRRWALAALCAFFAGMARSMGIVLIVPMTMELIAQIRQEVIEAGRPDVNWKKMFARAIALLAPVLGLGVYLVINYAVYGNPLKFLAIQKQHWQQAITFFWNTPTYQWEYLLHYLRDENPSGAFSLMGGGLLTFFGTLGVLVWGAKEIRASYTVYALCYFALSMGASWLLSAPRYMLCLFPLFLIAAQKIKSRTADLAMTVISAALLCGMLHMLLMSYDVF